MKAARKKTLHNISALPTTPATWKKQIDLRNCVICSKNLGQKINFWISSPLFFLLACALDL
jgi:hypothetical protein